MAEEGSLETTLVEERKELMVDPTTANANQNPTLRTAFFLKPSLNTYSLRPRLPKIHSFPGLVRPNVRFLCSSKPLEGWQTWVQELEATHETLWQKLDICDAIKGSTYRIAKKNDLIFRLSERWCPETNTFVFPWGEATVTLEDVFVLGGFSPLGESVFTCSLGENVRQVEEKLSNTYAELLKINHNLTHLRWKEHFMGRGKAIEHAGFLVLWLSRHVFPGKGGNVVTKSVFSMAAGLSCGVKFELASVILASIYRDLTLLKRKILSSISGHCNDDRTWPLSSPLHLVVVWAWERFLLLRPVPRIINCGEMRLARWENLAGDAYDDIDDMEMFLDSARETFRWRPYAMPLENWPFPKVHVNAGTWVYVDSEEECKLIARCLTVSQLVGFNCIEAYNPHRVALQLGFDQDIPEYIDRSKASCEPGWLEYQKNLKGLKMYLPHRLNEGDVTCRYSNWWRTRLDLQEAALVGFKRKKRSSNKVKKMSKCVYYDCGRTRWVNVQEEAFVGCKRKKRSSNRVRKMSKFCDRRNIFAAKDVFLSARKNPMEKSLSIEASSRYTFQANKNPFCSDADVPCNETVGLDYASILLNLANEVGLAAVENLSEHNAREQNLVK